MAYDGTVVVVGEAEDTILPIEEFIRQEFKRLREETYTEATKDEIREQLELLLTVPKVRYPRLSILGIALSFRIKLPLEMLDSNDLRRRKYLEACQARAFAIKDDPNRKKIEAERYEELSSGLKRIRPAIAAVSHRDWMLSGKPTLEDYIMYHHGVTFEQHLRGIKPEKKDDKTITKNGEEDGTVTEPEKEKKPKRFSKPPIAKLKDSTRIRLLKSADKLKRGRETTIIDLWKAQPDQVTTLRELAGLFKGAMDTSSKLAHRNVRFFILQAIERKDAEVVLGR